MKESLQLKCPVWQLKYLVWAIKYHPWQLTYLIGLVLAITLAWGQVKSAIRGPDMVGMWVFLWQERIFVDSFKNCLETKCGYLLP